MIKRDALIWGSAIALSILLHLLIFVDRGSVAGVEQPKTTATTRVSFRSVAAPPSPPQEAPQPEVTEKPEEEVVEAPAPPPKPKPKKKKKVAEKVRQPEPPKPAPTPEPATPPAPSTQSAEKTALPAEASAGSVDDPALLEQTKNEYLRRLMAHIESHKHYPRAARRRGIEGEVAVSLRLLPGGGVADVAVAQGHRILRRAVEQAIDEALPMPEPPQALNVPMDISFSVMFSLRD